MTLALNATHPGTGYKQYDTHSLYGHMQSKATWEVLVEGADQLSSFKDKRQFVLSRSTFSGSGMFASHWLGDNKRTWEDMRLSIAGIMNFNMFGIPHVGADVCGFSANSDMPLKEQQELCARWIQLSVFYPFARQHTDEQGGLEPYNLGDYQLMAVAAIKERYKYLMFMYGCLAEAEASGTTCVDPLFFHYPEIPELYNMSMESTFIVGDAIKVSPVLEKQQEGQKEFTSFFPQGRWVNFYDYSIIDV